MNKKTIKELELELYELIKYKAYITNEQYLEGLLCIRSTLIQLLLEKEVKVQDYQELLDSVLRSLDIKPSN